MKHPSANPSAQALGRLRQAPKTQQGIGQAHEAAVELGRAGGKVGGVHRAKQLTPVRRKEIAKMGGAAKAKKAEEKV